jgi:hypothetical protein
MFFKSINIGLVMILMLIPVRVLIAFLHGTLNMQVKDRSFYFKLYIDYLSNIACKTHLSYIFIFVLQQVNVLHNNYIRKLFFVCLIFSVKKSLLQAVQHLLTKN